MYRLLAAALIVIALTCGLGRESAAQLSTYGDAMRWYEREGAKGSAKAHIFSVVVRKRRWPRKRTCKGVPVVRQSRRARACQGTYKIPGYQFGLGTVSDPRKPFYGTVALRGRGCPKHSTIWFTCWRMLFGTERSPNEAVRWYREAAERGFGPSQFALGSVYMRGMGVERNLAEAWTCPRGRSGRLPALAKPVLLWKGNDAGECRRRGGWRNDPR